MKFYGLNSKREVNVNITPYLIDWDHKVSSPQKMVSDFLRPYWKTHVVLSEFRIPRSLLRVDILNLSIKCAVEVSPKGSHSYNPFFHKSKANFGAAMKREIGKADWLEKNGFKLVEVFDEDFARLSREWFHEQGVNL